MLRNSIFLLWFCGTLLVATFGLGAWAITQTLKVANLTAELAFSSAELATTRAAHRDAISKQKAKARLQRGLVAVPVIGAGLVLYFEEKDYQEWLAENPDGDRAKYVCEIAKYTADIIDDLVLDTIEATKDLPTYTRPDTETVRSWLEVPIC